MAKLQIENGEYIQALKMLKDLDTSTLEDLELMGLAESKLHNFQAAYGYYLLANNTEKARNMRELVPISELEKVHKDRINKCRLLRVKGRRGVFATAKIKMGEEIFKISLDKCVRGSLKELAEHLKKDTVYKRSLPKQEFPVEWSESLKDQINVSPLRLALEHKIKIYEEEKIDFNHRSLVGSRNFANGKDTYLIPFADMLNHSKDANIDWKFTDTEFIMSATENIAEHEELFDSYGPKSNYETFLHYGFVEPNLELNVVRVIAKLPMGVFQTRIDPRFFQQDFEFELLGQYKEGTVEIFSFLRYIRSNEKKCPETIKNYLKKPVSRENELWCCKMLFNMLQKDVKRRVDASAFGVTEPLAISLLQTEMNVLVFWGETLMEAIQILEKNDKKKAKKSKRDYIVRIIKKLL